MDYIKILSNAWDDYNAVYRVVEYRSGGVSSMGEYKLRTEDGREFVRELADSEVHWMEAKDW